MSKEPDRLALLLGGIEEPATGPACDEPTTPGVWVSDYAEEFATGAAREGTVKITREDGIWYAEAFAVREKRAYNGRRLIGNEVIASSEDRDELVKTVRALGYGCKIGRKI